MLYHLTCHTHTQKRLTYEIGRWTAAWSLGQARAPLAQQAKAGVMEHLTRKLVPGTTVPVSGTGWAKAVRRVGVGPSGPCAGLLQCMQGEGLQPPS